MTNKKVKSLILFLNQLYPNSKCSLEYKKDYELLIATMLSAQTSDKAVNIATRSLFSRFPDLKSLNEAPLLDIENEIKHLGLSKIKAKNIKGIVSSLINDFDGVVPNDKQKLMSLPGVGNKTSNVVLAELFNEAYFAVDRHVERIAKRLEFVPKNASNLAVEHTLISELPKDKLRLINHQLIDFGRTICKAQNPKCEKCNLAGFCRVFH